MGTWLLFFTVCIRNKLPESKKDTLFFYKLNLYQLNCQALFDGFMDVTFYLRMLILVVVFKFSSIFLPSVPFNLTFFLCYSLSDVFSNFLNLWWCLAAFTCKSKTLKSCLEALCG